MFGKSTISQREVPIRFDRFDYESNFRELACATALIRALFMKKPGLTREKIQNKQAWYGHEGYPHNNILTLIQS